MLGFPLDSRVTYVTDPDTGVIIPKYDRAVTSKPLREYIRGIITTGVLPNPSDNLQVFPGTDGMTVIVHAGFAVVDGGLAKEDNNRTLEVTASDATYDRIDTVVVRWNDNDSVRNVDLYIKQGVPARNPVRPTLTREGSVYEIGLADIFVTKNVRTITAEKITDTRLESSRCGVASSIAKWDTTTIYQQIQSDLAGFKSNEQAEFMNWFDKMKDQLTEDAAGKLQTEVDDVQRQIHTNLLNPTAQTQTINGVTFTNNGDGTYTVNGTANTRTSLLLYTINDTDFSVFQNKKFVGCPTGGSSGTYQLTFACYNGNTWLKEFDDYGNGIVISNIPSNATKVSVIILVMNGQTVNNLIFKPMLTTDLDATYDDFVQYSGDGELNENVAEIYKVSDRVSYETHTNLLKPTGPTQTINGVTFTNNEDGTYTVNGTASNATYFPIANQFTDLDLSREYKIVGCPQGSSENTYSLYDDINPKAKDTGNGAVYTPAHQPKLYIRLIKGTTCNNLLFKPMLTTDLSATYDDFVPYTGDSGRLNEDVANLVKEISPITTSEIDTILNS